MEHGHLRSRPLVSSPARAGRLSGRHVATGLFRSRSEQADRLTDVMSTLHRHTAHSDESGRSHPVASRHIRAWRLARRTAILLAGTAVVVAGLALLVLPGPGVLTIAAGLSLLATEFTWARRLLQHLRGRLGAALAAARGRRWWKRWGRRVDRRASSRAHLGEDAR